MPIYEYRCDQCGLEKEYLQKVSDAPISICPSCGSGMTKLMSAAGFQLKGSGWYATDFRNSGAKPATKEAATSDAAAGDAASGDAAAKPDSADKAAIPAVGADKPADRKEAPAAAASTAPPGS